MEYTKYYLMELWERDFILNPNKKPETGFNPNIMDNTFSIGMIRIIGQEPNYIMRFLPSDKFNVLDFTARMRPIDYELSKQEFDLMKHQAGY